MSTFTGFSEEDLKRIKLGETNENNTVNKIYMKKSAKTAVKSSKSVYKYKTPVLQKQSSEDTIDNMQFDKCKLSIKESPSIDNNINEIDHSDKNSPDEDLQSSQEQNIKNKKEQNIDTSESRRESIVSPDIVRVINNYTENDTAPHKLKLEELQLRQKLMEEQNKKRKEMLSKVLADRTKQTSEEVMRLEKIKQELQVLDGQFSQDVAVLRKKIDQACLSYSEAEKHYLKVEKEFLQAKINLQKEKEKKELLTEHLCALITYNETRKAQKLENLMLELADEKMKDIQGAIIDDENPVIIDGVDERTGKIVELPNS